MLHRIVEGITKVISRRTLFSRTISAAAAVTSSICGLEDAALACSGTNKLCCFLCLPNTPCHDRKTQCTGTWCWTCPYGTGDNCVTLCYVSVHRVLQRRTQ